MADVISFRASYETEAHWRVLPNVKSALSVAEAKVLIARELGLEREFARTFDLELYVVADDAAAARALCEDDNQLILPGTRLVVNRVLWGQVPNVVHSSSKAVGAWVKGEETKQPPPREEDLPDGLKCARCRHLARNPLLARCSRGCTKSVCKACAELLVSSGTPAECPACHQRSVASFVPNRTLALLVAKIDGDAHPADLHAAGKPGTKRAPAAAAAAAEDAHDMWLLFVDPQQLAIVHRDGFVVLPWLVEDHFCQRLKDSISLCVLATGGGGTSIVSPGNCRVQRLWYCKADADAAAPAPVGVGNTPSLQPLIDLWYKDNAQTRAGDGYVILELQWISRYPSLVLLPGKAQPIAGILAAAPRDAYAISLTNTQKQGVTQRLYSEAHFARCSGSAPAPAGLGTILARLNKSASSASEDRTREAVEKMWNVLKARNIWTGTHWNRTLRVNPLIPWTATLPKLTEAQFTLVRKLQLLANAAINPKTKNTKLTPTTNAEPPEVLQPPLPPAVRRATEPPRRKEPSPANAKTPTASATATATAAAADSGDLHSNLSKQTTTQSGARGSRSRHQRRPLDQRRFAPPTPREATASPARSPPPPATDAPPQRPQQQQQQQPSPPRRSQPDWETPQQQQQPPLPPRVLSSREEPNHGRGGWPDPRRPAMRYHPQDERPPAALRAPSQGGTRRSQWTEQETNGRGTEHSAHGGAQGRPSKRQYQPAPEPPQDYRHDHQAAPAAAGRRRHAQDPALEPRRGFATGELGRRSSPAAAPPAAPVVSKLVIRRYEGEAGAAQRRRAAGGQSPEASERRRRRGVSEEEVRSRLERFDNDPPRRRFEERGRLLEGGEEASAGRAKISMTAASVEATSKGGRVGEVSEEPRRQSERRGGDRRRVVVESSDDATSAGAAARLFSASLPKPKRPRNTLFS